MVPGLAYRSTADWDLTDLECSAMQGTYCNFLLAFGMTGMRRDGRVPGGQRPGKSCMGLFLTVVHCCFFYFLTTFVLLCRPRGHPGLGPEIHGLGSPIHGRSSQILAWFFDCCLLFLTS